MVFGIDIPWRVSGNAYHTTRTCPHLWACWVQAGRQADRHTWSHYSLWCRIWRFFCAPNLLCWLVSMRCWTTVHLWCLCLHNSIHLTQHVHVLCKAWYSSSWIWKIEYKKIHLQISHLHNGQDKLEANGTWSKACLWPQLAEYWSKLWSKFLIQVSHCDSLGITICVWVDQTDLKAKQFFLFTAVWITICLFQIALFWMKNHICSVFVWPTQTQTAV